MSQKLWKLDVAARVTQHPDSVWLGQGSFSPKQLRPRALCLRMSARPNFLPEQDANSAREQNGSRKIPGTVALELCLAKWPSTCCPRCSTCCCIELKRHLVPPWRATFISKDEPSFGA